MSTKTSISHGPTYHVYTDMLEPGQVLIDLFREEDNSTITGELSLEKEVFESIVRDYLKMVLNKTYMVAYIRHDHLNEFSLGKSKWIEARNKPDASNNIKLTFFAEEQ